MRMTWFCCPPQNRDYSNSWTYLMLDEYCQNWALAVNLKKTNIMIFQKRPRCQEDKYKFTLNGIVIEHTMSYTYLGLTVSASGNFNMAVNVLKGKARRALYTI